MKKLLAIFAALALAAACVGGTAAENEAEPKEKVSLTVGITSEMTGHFFTEKWGENTSDVDLRELIHGHNTISWEQNDNYTINNTVLQELTAWAQGTDKVYVLVLSDNLTYNDGTPITAWDYAFSALLLSSNELEALGGTPTNLDFLKGNAEYRQGKPYPGVHVVDDTTLELMIDGAYLPYFYEITLLNLIPYPIGVIAPGCAVKDDGEGVYIEGPFTEELLRKTIMDKETGYLYHPTVTAGPYRLLSFDLQTQTARFEKNQYYTGNYEGIIPTIDEITVVCADMDTALEDVVSGKLDLVNRVSDGHVITEALDLAREGRIQIGNYLRSGLSFISFSCELGPTRSANVRKAIAHCVDADRANSEFTLGYGLPIYGFYGLGQWMTMQNRAAVERYATPLNLATAAKLLDEDGWTLNESGGAYDPEADGVRWRLDEDGNLEKLSIRWAQTQGTALSEILEAAAWPYMEAVGMEVEVVQMPFAELIAQYYRQTERVYHMINVATNFSLAFDPYYMFHTGDEYQGEGNKTGLIDDLLMRYALDMRRTDVGNAEAYVAKWLQFQERVSQLQPIVPLFSNVYFDFFGTHLRDYTANAYFSWATAIVYVRVEAREE